MTMSDDDKRTGPSQVLYAVMSYEGLCATRTPNGWMPLVAMNPDKIRNAAEEMAVVSGQMLWLVKYVASDQIETIMPTKGGSA